MRAPARRLESDIERRVDVLEAIVADLQRRRPRRHDPDRDARRCSALALAFGARVFTALEVRASGQADVVAAFDGTGPRQIGAWLKRVRAQPLAGYCVERVGRDEAGVQWSVAVSAIRHTGAGDPPDRGAR